MRIVARMLLIPLLLVAALACFEFYRNGLPRLQLLPAYAAPTALLAGMTVVVAWAIGLLFSVIAEHDIHGDEDDVKSTEFDFREPPADMIGVPGKPSLFDVLKYELDLLNNRINSEYQSVSEKVGWLVTSQAFLVAGFVTLLNNTVIRDVARFEMMLGIAAIGFSGSIALSAGIFYGHAWCEYMKRTRQVIEKRAYEAYGVPRTGVPASYGAHRRGHFVTKLLPSIAIAAWLTIIVMIVLGRLAPDPDRLAPPATQQQAAPAASVVHPG
jgi:hypothetical protein